MAKKYVPEGAYLACDKGTSPSTLRVTNNVKTTIYAVAMATEADKLPFFNIRPMGICMLKGSACLPMVLKWDKPKDGVKINGNRMLLEDSTCKCMMGGEIRIFFDRPSAVAYGTGEGRMPSEYIKEGFDFLAKQNEALEREREKMLPDWMEGVADVGDWFGDLNRGLVEGAVNGVVGLGETIYQVGQDPVGMGEAIGGMAQKGWNATKDAWNWVKDGDWEKRFDDTVKWAGKQNLEDMGKGAVQGARDAGTWVAANPRKIGNTVGEFIPDAVAAVYTGGGSVAASTGRRALREGVAEVVEHSVDDVAKLADDALEAGIRSTDDVLEQLAKKEGGDIAAVVTKSADELADDVAKQADDVAKKADELADPPGTFRDSKGRLRDKNGRFAKDPKAKGKTKKPTYKRNMSERKKALERDAKDPNSGLDQKARDYIDKHKGRKVPNKKYNKDYDGDTDYAVHHEEPLYTEKTMEGKAKLDKADKMKTIPEKKHIETHSFCGDAYHDFGPPQNFK